MVDRSRFIVRVGPLDAVNQHVGDIRMDHLCIKHHVVQVGVGPFQPQIPADERSSRLVGSVDLSDRLIVRFAPSD